MVHGLISEGADQNSLQRTLNSSVRRCAKMKALSEKEARKWCQAQGASLENGGFPAARSKSKSFHIPSDAGARVALVAKHLENFHSLGKTLVWFDDWEVWPSGQRMHIFNRFLAAYGEAKPLIEIPAFLFSEQEFDDLVSFVTLGVLFLWDVHVICTKARQLVFYSHDEVGWIGA